MQFLGAPHRTNHPHSRANPAKEGTKQKTVKNANKTGGANRFFSCEIFPFRCAKIKKSGKV